LGAPLEDQRVDVVAPPVRAIAERSKAGAGEHALVVSRLAPEKGVDVAIDACVKAGRPLVIVGAGPERQALEARVARAGRAGELVRFAGRVDGQELAELRARAAVALIPSRSGETFGLAAAEAMAAGVPVVASAAGALMELVEKGALVPAGDAEMLAERMSSLWGDENAGARALQRAREVCGADRVAKALGQVYAAIAPPTGRQGLA
jgi:glycosyltransferase involved in cell wall biosynthesis